VGALAASAMLTLSCLGDSAGAIEIPEVPVISNLLKASTSIVLRAGVGCAISGRTFEAAPRTAAALCSGSIVARVLAKGLIGAPFPYGFDSTSVEEFIVGVGPPRSTVPAPVGSPRKSALVSTPVSSEASPFEGVGCEKSGTIDRSGMSEALGAESGHG